MTLGIKELRPYMTGGAGRDFQGGWRGEKGGWRREKSGREEKRGREK